MSSHRGAWALVGLASGAAGLATSYAVASVMAVRHSPVVAVAELVVQLAPGALIERAIGTLGSSDKPLLIAGIFALLGVASAGAGLLAARRRWAAIGVFTILAAIGAAAIAVSETASAMSYLPIVTGLATWVLVLPLLADRLHRRDRDRADGRHDDRDLDDGGRDDRPVARPDRRGFVVGAGAVLVLSAGLGVLGRLWGRARREVEAARRLLRLTGVSEPRVPRSARIRLPGVAPWQTDDDDFYLIHTAIALPTIQPDEWRLRIHGMVERDVVVDYLELLERRRTEAWITLNCVSNPVGGDLIGNAWWSGVRLADLLEEAGVSPDADALLQTAEDGWTCGTPLSAVTDGREAMVAVAMNGRPLPVEHGFPARTIVPGLYGFVSATKWLVDIEVTRFDRFQAYWTTKGWAEQAPVRLGSRVDVPRSGSEVEAGPVRVGGVAWQQHVGIDAVEVSLDGGGWQPVEIAGAPNDDTWVQWAGTVGVTPGDHVLRVRATSRDGEVQTGVERDPVPDGATGWHEVEFSAS